MPLTSNSTGYQIIPTDYGIVVDYSLGDVNFSPAVQLWVADAGTLKYDDNAGNTEQELSNVAAGALTPFKVIKVYQTGTSALIVAVK